MAELNISKVTTTSLDSDVKDYSVDSYTPDMAGEQPETTYDYPNSAQYLGYYKNIPELKRAIDALATWTVGIGWTSDNKTTNTMDNLKGWGEDSFQSICWNLIVQKKIFGDAFAEIIRNDRGVLINLKPLYTGDMRVIVNKEGIVKRYEHRPSKTKFDPSDILHIVNDRVCNEIHGTSVIEACKWVIDARNEALNDERMIKHRQLALGVLYVDTDDTTKINAIKTQYSNAIKNGEVLVLPKDTAALEDSKVTPADRIQWIQYLENFFYQAVGIPRVIATSENYTEAASKVGFLTFEPIYTSEQTLLESDLWNQCAIKVKFNRPPSLSGVMQQSEDKNTGQTNFQANEVTATAGRVE